MQGLYAHITREGDALLKRYRVSSLQESENRSENVAEYLGLLKTTGVFLPEMSIDSVSSSSFTLKSEYVVPVRYGGLASESLFEQLIISKDMALVELCVLEVKKLVAAVDSKICGYDASPVNFVFGTIQNSHPKLYCVDVYPPRLFSNKLVDYGPLEKAKADRLQEAYYTPAGMVIHVLGWLLASLHARDTLSAAKIIGKESFTLNLFAKAFPVYESSFLLPELEYRLGRVRKLWRASLPPVTLCLAAAGKSSRAGSNKLFFEVEGRPLIEALLRSFCIDLNVSQIVLVTGDAKLISIAEEFCKQNEMGFRAVGPAFNGVGGAFYTACSVVSGDIILSVADTIATDYLPLMCGGDCVVATTKTEDGKRRTGKRGAYFVGVYFLSNSVRRDYLASFEQIDDDDQDCVRGGEYRFSWFLRNTNYMSVDVGQIAEVNDAGGLGDFCRVYKASITESL